MEIKQGLLIVYIRKDKSLQIDDWIFNFKETEKSK